MDPITLILTALATGATAGASATATEAVKDSYNGLKTLIKRKFKKKKKPEAEIVLNKHEEKPNVWEAPLKEALVETATDKDVKIIRAAQKLMALVNPQQAAMGKFNVQIIGSNVQGFIQGDNANVTMNFGDTPREK